MLYGVRTFLRKNRSLPCDHPADLEQLMLSLQAEACGFNHTLVAEDRQRTDTMLGCGHLDKNEAFK